jgi:maltose/maltodextrin transport system substrate-binding protein
MRVAIIKIRTLMASALLVVSILPALAMADRGTLLIWIGADRGYRGMTKIGEEFTKKTGVKVVVEHPDDLPSQFVQPARIGEGPDIVIWTHDRIGEWFNAGRLQPLNPSKAVLNSAESFGWSAFTVGGKIYGYPISVETVALIYNTDLVPVPPKSFNEVLALDQKLKVNGKQAILWDYTNALFTWPLLAAGGAQLFSPKIDGSMKTAINNAGAIDGIEILMKLINSGAMKRSASYTDVVDGFTSGKVAMMINGPWAWTDAKKAGINVGASLIPTVNGKQAQPFVSVLGAMVSISSANKELAIEFLQDQMLSVDGLKILNADVALGVPTNKELFKELRSDPLIVATLTSTRNGVPTPSNPAMQRFWTVMKTALENITEGRQSAKEGLDAAAQSFKNDAH